MPQRHQVLFAIGLGFLTVGVVRCGLEGGRPASRGGIGTKPGCEGSLLDDDLAKSRRLGVEALIAGTYDESRVVVGFEPDEERLFRFFQNSSYVPLKTEDEKVEAILHVRQGLRPYSTELLPQVLSRVVVVRKLWRWENPICGYASAREDLIFTTLDCLKSNGTLHHEIGHLLEAGWFDESWLADWESFNPSGWEYPYENPWDEAKLNGPRTGDPQGQGFVSSYGSTNVQEDFAEYFELFMQCPDALDAVAGKHERIAAKRAVLQEFVDWLGILSHGAVQ